MEIKAMLDSIRRIGQKMREALDPRGVRDEEVIIIFNGPKFYRRI
jgi:hypothetical protein